ncbi:MAG: DegT/DnrJ/EryC1/StrS family aminotransferase [Candidatus Marinimicrobia bacterium]|jgi:dTDP-4-amino-4,6-dideoxygalactose transaminase|nr:DegT/DnrJ/EryC1/StrS family aminotransferase [Candidatus Neomarinimicrobiota bacterium]MBT3677100.1 DegT/DnrJ/EryC1/StrS family aminotransferase [Candidatus Neomarinimicrobiota bacterium]MBT3762753.1 DegT/DnrJ/EryC1/StrS family aminotransferase [Candidatus Neomarinimicrobiota bacterium]MBT4270984.1 DegT/DnrJ/EryC1/StrS family aminotransferase [Candidatus Neomarinimicrobiota bacterium]MBT4372308.1 DegT/DnrJ/EryC1/StrS family aminotransferase [Candidatus Neomarinimicrobiota bacterium]
MTKLAIHGGNPIRRKPFPEWPRPTSELKDAIIATLENEGWGVGSSAISRFEEKFAEFHDAKYCISTSSGTTALWVLLKAAGVKAGDEVIVPPYTFIATASAVLMANAVPVFVDIDPNTFNIDANLIEAAVTEKTKAIMPVHISGNPANMDAILAIGKKHGIPILEDAAQAHGAEWNSAKVGALGLGGIFSFQTSKNMSAGEGGAIVSNNEAFYEKCFSYHNCGRTKGGEFYEHSFLGGNFRLNAMATSMLIPQIDSIKIDMKLRDMNRQKLDNAIGQIEGISLNGKYDGTTRESNHIYLTRYDSNAFHGIPREKFFKAMQAEGVYTYMGYTPLYREKLFVTDANEYPWLKGYDYGALQMSVTERLADEEAVWLKQNHLLGDAQDIRDIIDAFEKVTTALRKFPELFKN